MTRAAIFSLLAQHDSVNVAMTLSCWPSWQLRTLPCRRKGFTDKLKIGGYTIYLGTGEYPDGQLAEIFLDSSKQGAMLRALLNCFAISISMGLQSGIPLSRYVNAFRGMKFEPSGTVDGHAQIHKAESIIDLIFRDLELNYLEGDDVPQDDGGREGISREARGNRGSDEEHGSPGAPEDLPDRGGAL